jgi:hypothetical protein
MVVQVLPLLDIVVVWSLIKSNPLCVVSRLQMKRRHIHVVAEHHLFYPYPKPIKKRAPIRFCKSIIWKLESSFSNFGRRLDTVS